MQTQLGSGWCSRHSPPCRFVSSTIFNFLVASPVQGEDFVQPDCFNICGTLLLFLIAMAEILDHLLKTLAGLETILPGEVQQLLAGADLAEKKAKVDEVLGLLSTGLVPFVQLLKVKCWNCDDNLLKDAACILVRIVPFQIT